MKKGILKIIPFGGLDEIGKNMMAIEFENEIIVIDVGSSFPDEDMYGVQVVIPDYSYLFKRKHKLKHVFITHGHEDHIGGIKYFLDLFPHVTVHSTKLTKHLIEKKFKKTPHFIKNLKEINKDSVIKTKHFEVSFFNTNHSIPDSLGIVLKTKYGNIVHTGDIKVDFTPIDNNKMDFNRIANIRKEGVFLLLSDSTNSKKNGFSKSEKVVAENLEKIIRNIKNKRIIATTFASSLYRIQSLINIAEKYDKKVVAIGRSMEENILIAKEAGYLKMNETTLIRLEDINKVDPTKLLVLTTGSQGESTSALKRMIENRLQNFSLTENDIVIFSSNTVPGNEKYVNNLKNELEKLNIEYIHNDDLHTSGHGYKEELKLILSLFNPKYFIPIHGEYSMLKEHSELAKLVGIGENNIFILKNGDVLEYDGRKMFVSEQLELECKLVDESEDGTVSFNVLRDRERMSTHGVVVAKVKDKIDGIQVKLIYKGIVVNFDKYDLEREIKLSLEKLKHEKGELDFLSITKTIQTVFKEKLNRFPLIVLN